MRKLLILSAALVTGAATDARAQDKPLPAKPDSGCTTFPDGRVECIRVRRNDGDVQSTVYALDSLLNKVSFRRDSTLMKRAALGIELRATGTRRDTLGVFVAAVTPRGPAETAGIVEGDRIGTINGVDVRSAAADVDDSYTNGIAAHRLTREVHKLSPGARVTLRVYSGGRFRDVVVTTGRASDVLRQAGRFNFRVPGPGGMEFRGPDGAMMFKRDMPLRIERFGPPGRTRINSLPRKTELWRAAPTRVRVPQPGTVAAPRQGELLALDAETMSELDVMSDIESDLLESDLENVFESDTENDAFELEMEPVET